MTFFRSICVLALLMILVPLAAQTQDAAEPLEVDEIAEDYIRAIRLKGVQSEVEYYDPTRAPPDFVTNEKPKPEGRKNNPNTSGGINLPFALITGAILIGIVALFLKFGSSGSLVLRKDVQNPNRGQAEGRKAANNASLDMQSFDGILRNPDRQQALINLAQLLIYKAVSANDLLLQRSWTARDVLRRMPKNSSYLSELNALVLKGELVHFGERNVSEEEFADYAARAKPLLRELSL